MIYIITSTNVMIYIITSTNVMIYIITSTNVAGVRHITFYGLRAEVSPQVVEVRRIVRSVQYEVRDGEQSTHGARRFGCLCYADVAVSTAIVIGAYDNANVGQLAAQRSRHWFKIPGTERDRDRMACCFVNGRGCCVAFGDADHAVRLSTD